MKKEGNFQIRIRGPVKGSDVAQRRDGFRRKGGKRVLTSPSREQEKGRQPMSVRKKRRKKTSPLGDIEKRKGELKELLNRFFQNLLRKKWPEKDTARAV